MPGFWTRRGPLIDGSSGRNTSTSPSERFHRQKPVLTSIRSPYDWYVSHYEFAWWKIDPGDLFDDAAVRTRFLSYPELEFGDFVHAINDWRVLPQAWREFARQMEAARIGWLSWDSINRLAWHPEPVLEIPPRLAQGQHLPANSHHPEVRFLRTSMLNEDLHAFLLGQGFRASDVDFVLTLDRVYPKEGGRHPAVAWRDYYDAELQAFVRQREHVLFDLFPEFDVVEDLAK